MSDWNTIDTAPKDGSWIVVFSPSYVFDPVRPAQYVHDAGLDEFIWNYSGEGYEYTEGPEAPTHWHPLPLPPLPPPRSQDGHTY